MLTFRKSIKDIAWTLMFCLIASCIFYAIGSIVTYYSYPRIIQIRDSKAYTYDQTTNTLYCYGGTHESPMTFKHIAWARELLNVPLNASIVVIG